jgi:hypothetical protein
MIAPDGVGVTIVALMGAAVALWAIPDGRGCPQCPHCRQERDARERLQRELAHDIDHKGAGYRPEAPDRYRCTDESCPRNARIRRAGSAPGSPRRPVSRNGTGTGRT